MSAAFAIGFVFGCVLRSNAGPQPSRGVNLRLFISVAGTLGSLFVVGALVRPDDWIGPEGLGIGLGYLASSLIPSFFGAPPDRFSSGLSAWFAHVDSTRFVLIALVIATLIVAPWAALKGLQFGEHCRDAPATCETVGK